MENIRSFATRNLSRIITFLFLANLLLRSHGIWFPRWAWDEAEYYFGAVNITTFLSGLLQGEWRTEEWVDFMGPNGTLNKFICVIPVSAGIFLERLFDTQYPVPLGLIFCRIALALIPNVLVIYYAHKIVKLICNTPAAILINLFLFLLPFRLVETSVYAVSDSLVTLLCISSLYYFIRYRTESFPVRKMYFLKISLILCMLAISTKCPPGCAVAVSVFIVLMYDWFTNSISRNFLGGLFPFVYKRLLPLFILINLPYLLLFDLWLKNVFGYLYVVKGHPLYYFYSQPTMGMGILLTGLALLGMIWAVYRYGKTLLPVLLFIIIFYTFLSTTYGATHNWHIPLLPFLIIFCSLILHAFYSFIKNKAGTIAAAAILITILAGFSFAPLKNQFLFKQNILEKPDALQLVKDYLKEIPSDNYIIIRDEKIKSISDLEKSGVEYIVLNHDWFSLENHPYPAYLLRYENFQKQTFGTDWLTIQKHVKENWKLVKTIHPRHPSPWTNNSSVNAEYFIYKHSDSL